MKGSWDVGKRSNLAGIAWLVFVGLAAAVTQSLPLVQTIWLARATATTRQASHEPAEVSTQSEPASHPAGEAKTHSTAG
ncbi:MAG: hypothetical protein KJZ65_11555 [Phycisphaerales bacterium]|nr:hypothetical protein [Phycisphaerales bacterium]